MKRFVFVWVCVVFRAISCWGVTVTIDGGTYTKDTPYTLTAASSDDFLFTNGGYMTVSGNNQMAFSGSFSGNGNLTIRDTAREQLRFTGSFADFTGTITTANHVWYTFYGASSNHGSAQATWAVNTSSDTGLLLDGASVSSSTNPIKLGRLEGNGQVRPMGNQGTVTHYIQVGGALTNVTDTSTFSGAISTHNGDTVHVEKVGAGTWILTGGNSFTGGLVVSEGTMWMGNGGETGSFFSNSNTITVEKNGTFGYNRNNLPPGGIPNAITVKGGTLTNGGAAATYSDVTFENGGKIAVASGGQPMTFNNLKLTGDGTETSVLTVDSTYGRVTLNGLSLSGTSPKEIYLTGSRTNFLYLNGDLSQYDGTFTAGPATNGTKGTWMAVQAANDFSKTTFNLNPGENIDAGLLTNYVPAEGDVLKLGALEGNGIVRGNSYGVFYALQIGGNNQDATFSGSIHGGYQSTDFSVEKVGTGTWTITSDNTQYAANVTGYKNGYTGDTTITAGTLQLGDYDPVTQTGGATGQLGGTTDSSKLTKIVIGENGTLAIARNTAIDFMHNIDSNGGTIQTVYAESAAYDVALRGTLTGSFTKTGKGTLSIGTDAVSGLTKVNIQEGTFLNFAASRLGNGSVTMEFTGGTFQEYYAGTVLANEFRLTGDGTVNMAQSFTLTGTLSGTGTLTQIGEETLTLAGGKSGVASTANLDIMSGTLKLARTNDLATANNLTMETDGTLLLATPNQSISGTLSLAEGSEILVDLAAFESVDYTEGDALLDVLAVTGTPGFTLDYSGEINRSTDIPYDANNMVAGLVVPTEALEAFLNAHTVGGIQALVLVNGHLVYNSSALPEPASWILLLLGLALWKRRR